MAAALAAGGPFLDAKYGAYRSWEQDKALPADDAWSARFDELARDRFLLGDPARVRDEVARYRERLGITTLIVRVQWPGMDQAAVLRSIRLLGEQVLPALGA
jgi:alkanesulfonate monooxygenase SsuD/methylene tetrahydromethanopterin reductase-like flavin-dependent oxidoreductase (luciferase family)